MQGSVCPVILSRMKLKSNGILLFVVLILTVFFLDNVYALRVTPGRFDHFALQLPEKIAAGGELTIKILAQDYNNNLIPNFSEAGRAFNISVSAPSTIRLIQLPPDSFQGGVASISLSVNKPEKLTLYIYEVNEPSAVLVEDIDVTQDKADNLLPAVSGKTATEKTHEPAKKTSELQKTASVSPLPVKEKSREVIKKPLPTKEKKEKQVALNKTVKHKTASAAPAVKEILASAVKEAKNEKAPKPEPAQKARFFTVSDISMMEAGGKGLLVISGDFPANAAAVKYKKSLRKIQDREWLSISLTPAVRKTAATVKLNSEIIGEVLIENDTKEKDTVNIYIEFKDKTPFFDISEQKNALAVMISKTKF